jgi:drug/metabolite transporter (DMT)-like permease
MIVVGANSLAPLASGVSIELAALALGSLVFARLVLRERFDSVRLVGLTLIGARILLLATPVFASSTAGGWGVLLFVAAGGMCAGYAVLVRYWQIPPATAASVVAVVSLLTYAPYYLMAEDMCRLIACPWPLLAEQILAQGLIAGTASLIAFSMSVRFLGVATAGALPMLTPLIAACATWFLTGEYQTICGWVALTASAFGAIFLVLDFPSCWFRSKRA